MLPGARAKRTHILNLLHEYSAAAKFPANYDHPEERRPCFIDRNGNICAVGYLVEQTAGRPLAEKINKQHQYDKIADMKTPELLAWVENSGLTKEECAMIQPQYGYINPKDPNYVSTENGVTTAVWSGLNVSLAATSSIRTINNRPAKTASLLGIISGAGQIVYGSLTIPKKEGGWSANQWNNSQRSVSFINIGVGATALFLNTFNYFSKKPESKNSYGVYSFPTQDNQTGLAFSYTRRL
ncbi:MAG: hypothetical protein K0Q79_2587 [Flavipsychrobacter sp.]|jgi:hypothetical protein|nr:hypothetical protein [Flavipsychrobacter sp.]